jgi:hypothetical protein
MGTAVGPPHLLFLHHALAHDLIDGRLNEACRDGLSVPITIAVVRNECSIGSDVSSEFSNRFQQLALILAVSLRGPDRIPNLPQFVTLYEHCLATEFHLRHLSSFSISALKFGWSSASTVLAS